MPKFDAPKKEEKAAASSKKPAQNKKQTEQARINDEKRLQAQRQKAAIVLFGCAALLACLAFIKGESAWLVLHNAFFGLFGMCAFIWPVALLYLAIVYTRNKSIGSVAANIAGGAAFVTLFSAAVHIIRYLKVTVSGEKYLSCVSIGEQIESVWKSTEPLKTGGVFGAVIGGGLSRILGQTGALAVVIILLVVVLMFVTGMTLGGLANFFAKPVKKVGEMTNEKFEQSAAALQEQRERREKEKEERERKKAEGFEPPKASTKKKGKEKENIPETVDIIRDETTFTVREEDVKAEKKPAEHPVMPVINLPDINPEKPVEDVIEIAKKQPKEKQIKPAEKAEKKPASENEFNPPEIKGYEFPPIDCLDVTARRSKGDPNGEMQATANRLISTLDSFGVKAEVVNICRGPSVTRYEIEPDEGVRISRITRLSDDIALRLASSGVRIAAIPNKTAIGIEVPNESRETVGMREVIDTQQFRDSKSKLNVALGEDITGNLIFADLAKMPHLLIAGTTGSGKSVCLNTMIISILYNASPDEVKIVLIDPKQVEFTIYNGIAHLEVPVVANPRKAAGALGWAVSEMERRYKTFSENNVKDIKGYNRLAETRDGMKKMHQIVIFIDELSDLMMVAPNEVEDSICRLAQMARAAGMHLVVATQRPSVNVITGVIKANIPSRIALSVSSQIDSRTILDTSGAEKLLGYGDMLFSPIGSSKPQRVQGCYISEVEVERVVEHIKSSMQAEYNDDVMQEIENIAAATANSKKKGSASVEAVDPSSARDETIMQALEVLIKAGKASTTFLQNKLGWGYPKAARVMNELEEKGFIAPKEGNKERRVLITLQQLYEMNNSSDGASGLSGDYSAPEEAQMDFDDYSETEDDSDIAGMMENISDIDFED